MLCKYLLTYAISKENVKKSLFMVRTDSINFFSNTFSMQSIDSTDVKPLNIESQLYKYEVVQFFVLTFITSIPDNQKDQQEVYLQNIIHMYIVFCPYILTPITYFRSHITAYTLPNLSWL